jgi:hypothetical protein
MRAGMKKIAYLLGNPKALNPNSICIQLTKTADFSNRESTSKRCAETVKARENMRLGFSSFGVIYRHQVRAGTIRLCRFSGLSSLPLPKLPRIQATRQPDESERATIGNPVRVRPSSS